MVAVSVALVGWLSVAEAQYMITLKNGRQITAQSYREEGANIKVQGLGGEFGIAKDQIQSITKAAQGERGGLNIIEMDASTRLAPSAQKPSPAARETKASAIPGQTKSAEELEEEKQYQKRLAELTKDLEAARQEYFKATQGGGTASNVSKEGIRSWTMDFASRIHDSQKVPGGGGATGTPPTPPYAPSYTGKEKELSELRIKIDTLQKERGSLIEEMKRKNIPTGTL